VQCIRSHSTVLHSSPALLSACRPKYFFGFYFWLDVLSTLSLLFDLPQVLKLLTPVGAGQTTGTGGTLAAAGTTAYAAAKVGQILRLVRLARMLSIDGAAPQDKASPRANSSGRQSGTGGDGSSSRLGGKLVDLTTRRVVIGVWCILLASPLFDIKFYPQGNPTSFEFGGLQVVHDTCAKCALNAVAATGAIPATSPVGLPSLNASAQSTVPVCAASCYAAMDQFVSHTSGLLRLTVLGTDVGTLRYSFPALPSSLRSFEQLPVIVDGSKSVMNVTGANATTISTGSTSAIFDRAELYRLKAILGLCRIGFLATMLAAGVYSFTKDAERLVLRPIERMMRKVQDLGDNPLLAATVIDTTTAAGTLGRHASMSGRSSLAARLRARAMAKAENYETRLLESSVSKICSLMALGFGDAGAQIIAENMKSGGALNPMVPGKKMCAIFGFCDIRNFTDATEELQEEVMEFVNTIARLVHTHVTSRGGSANKNIGDAFLLVWKFPTTGVAVTAEDVDAVAAGKPPPGGAAVASAISAVADNALASFVAVFASLRTSSMLARFNNHPGLRARLGDGYAVRMGFGLHVGWAIEGAIGSEYKVDASYLSPHVNIAARLEGATKQFGVPLLLSSHFANLLSADVRQQCRMVDRVALKGCRDPLHLYTFDADSDFLLPAQAPTGTEGVTSSVVSGLGSTGSGTDSTLVVPTGSLVRGSGAANGSTGGSAATANGAATIATLSPGAKELLHAPYVTSMRSSLPPSFLASWRSAFEAYTAGRWGEARDVLTQHTLSTRVAAGTERAAAAPVVDGPSQALLEVMEKQGWKAPHGWAGFRELTEK
jgi:class 3 adenylate cyclase